MRDDPVRPSRNSGNFLRLGFRHIENLDTTGGNIYLVVMLVLVPVFQRDFLPRDGLGYEILDIREPRYWDRSIQTTDVAGLPEKFPCSNGDRGHARCHLQMCAGPCMDIKAIRRARLLSAAGAAAVS
ncbi:MAG: hypothetical protein ABI988_11170 [Nitrospirota bacterium]